MKRPAKRTNYMYLPTHPSNHNQNHPPKLQHQQPPKMAPKPSLPTIANYPSERLTIGCGVAIFHLASSRVVLCYHSRDNYYFLPKGRKNANESHTVAAEREGFEETGYHNRLLPLPLAHRQTQPDDGHVEFVTEVIWVQLLPLPAQAVQYILHWYAAETLPPDVEREYMVADEGSEVAGGVGRVYRSPPAFPARLTINERMRQDIISHESSEREIYEPVWHEGTGVDDEEALYRSSLVSIDEALRKLRGTVMADVVRRAWEAVQLRIHIEESR
jgi:8-oxo-dGTP pyrophosphatase MutT (NUDIX family)